MPHQRTVSGGHYSCHGRTNAGPACGQSAQQGWVLFVEGPVALNRAARHHRDATSFESLVGAIADFSTSYGLDLDCGLRLPAMMRSLGLENVDSEVSGSITHGGDAFRTWMRTTFRDVTRDLALRHDPQGWDR